MLLVEIDPGRRYFRDKSMATNRGIESNGEAIREKRKALGMTQEQLAARCDYSVRTIRSAENGSRIDVTTLSGIGNALSVPVHFVSAAVSDANEMEQNRQTAMEWEDAFFIRIWSVCLLCITWMSKRFCRAVKECLRVETFAASISCEVTLRESWS